MTERAPAAVAVILGSAYESFAMPHEPVDVETPCGPARLWRMLDVERPAYLLFRHGKPHRLLPTQINWRANAAALQRLGVQSLLVTSSVGVLDPAVPLFRSMLCSDLFYLDNRLPDGTACTMFVEPTDGQGHLVVDGGLFATELNEQVRAMARRIDVELGPEVVFGYVGGPRTKTSAENAWLATTSAQVNSMTLAPEVVLANELGIATAGLVVGHKYSIAGVENPGDDSLEDTLVASQFASDSLVRSFLLEARPVANPNYLYTF